MTYCIRSVALPQIAVTDFFTIDTESDMESYVMSTGPLSVCVAAEVGRAVLT